MVQVSWPRLPALEGCKLYTADVNAAIDLLQLGDWSVMASLLDVMRPIADVGFALEQNPVTSPYVLH